MKVLAGRLAMYPRRVFYGWWVVGASFVISLITSGVLSIGFTAFFEPIVKEFGWSYTQVSVASSLRSVETGLLAPLVGLLVGRWGPRRLIFGGAIAIGLGLVLLSRVTSLPMFYGAFILIGIGFSTCGDTSMGTAVVNWFHKKASTAIGIWVSGFALGGLLVPFVVMLIDSLDWRTAMLILGVGVAVVCSLLALLIRHKPEQYGYLPDGEVSKTSVANLRPPPEKKVKMSVQARQALTSRPFWHIAVASMCHSLAASAVMTHVMPYLTSIGIERSLSGLVASAIALMSFCGRLSFGWLGDKVNKRLATAAGFALLTVGVFLFGQAAYGTWLLIPFLITFGLGWGANVTMRSSLLRLYFGRMGFSVAFGFVTGVMVVGHVFGAPLAGWVFDTWGSYQGIWLVYAVVLGGAVVTVMTIPQPKDDVVDS